VLVFSEEHALRGEKIVMADRVIVFPVMKVEGITPEEAFEYILDRIGDETEQGIPFEVFWPSDLCDQLRFWDGHKEELHTMMMD